MNVKKILCCLALTSVLGVQVLKAQQSVQTLDSCIRYAWKHSIDARQADARYSSAKAAYINAIGQLLPQVSASTGVSFNFGRGLNAETNTYTDINSFSNNYSVSASMTLFDGFQSLFAIEEKRHQKNQSKLDTQKQRNLAALGTVEAYYNLLYSEGMYRLSLEKLGESSKLLEQVQRMEELGSKSHADVLEVAAREASDRASVSKAKNQALIAELQLKEKMNWPVEEDLVIDSIPREILDSVFVQIVSVDRQSVFKYAETNDPALQMARLQTRAAKASLKASWADFLPKIYVGAGFNTGFSRFMDGSEYVSFKEQLKNRRGHYVGFSLNIPLFSNFSKITGVSKSRASRVIAQLEEERARNTLYTSVVREIGDMQGALELYVQGVAQVKATELAYRAAQKRYQVGMISVIELSTTSNRYLEAQVNCLRAYTQYLLKTKYVKYYQGESFIEE
ncbi:hypothetical protein HQ47_08995 [Porphyromonas macacae]|uniref:TolC family protein n=1 Tax=Porphyromonas macacae TaxID=28115 RepID=A0A0A2E2E1_9PORP|nr:TolC family protein [Porphyromonas macacae]KGN72986.1 hypothetical protein HQ47_08995 [Porphyromonas macacae]